MATANNNSDRLLNFTLLVGDRVYLALFCGMYTQKPGRLLLLLVITLNSTEFTKSVSDEDMTLRLK